ncbi:MAG: phytanoyl-CoA dioxygenase family protein [Pseudomonadota bacterium]
MPEWRGLLRYVGSADAEPIIYVQTILSHVVAGPPDPQLALHADTFHATVKAWLFLTDVSEDEGPFTYVPGSHRLTAQRLAWERRMSIQITDGTYPNASDHDRLTRRGSFRVNAAILDELQLPPPRACAVPANTLVVADTFGFHARGASTRPSVRVEIWAYGRRSPFLPWVGLDMWQIPALAQRRAHWFWSASDMIEAAGGKRNVWRPRDDVSAFDPAA